MLRSSSNVQLRCRQSSKGYALLLTFLIAILINESMNDQSYRRNFGCSIVTNKYTQINHPQSSSRVGCLPRASSLSVPCSVCLEEASVSAGTSSLSPSMLTAPFDPAPASTFASAVAIRECILPSSANCLVNRAISVSYSSHSGIWRARASFGSFYISGLGFSKHTCQR